MINKTDEPEEIQKLEKQSRENKEFLEGLSNEKLIGGDNNSNKEENNGS